MQINKNVANRLLHCLGKLRQKFTRIQSDLYCQLKSSLWPNALVHVNLNRSLSTPSRCCTFCHQSLGTLLPSWSSLIPAHPHNCHSLWQHTFFWIDQRQPVHNLLWQGLNRRLRHRLLLRLLLCLLHHRLRWSRDLHCSRRWMLKIKYILVTDARRQTHT